MIRRSDYETYHEYAAELQAAGRDNEIDEQMDEEEAEEAERMVIYCTECEAEATGYYVSEPEKNKIPLCDTCMQIFQVGLYYGLKGIDVETGSIEDMKEDE